MAPILITLTIPYSNLTKPPDSVMEPLCISVNDNNAEFLLKREKMDPSKAQDAIPLDNAITNSRSMFPNRIKYIFDDDIEEEQEQVIDEGEETGTTGNSKDALLKKHNDSTYENAIVVNMNGDYQIEDVHLFSDKYHLLGFKSSTQESIQGTEKFNNVLDIEVISKFKDLSKYMKDVPLTKLIDIYDTQNKQLASLCGSI